MVFGIQYLAFGIWHLAFDLNKARVIAVLIEAFNDDSIEYSYQVHRFPEIIDYANQSLNPKGVLQYDASTDYCYLKISDNYIYDIFPLLKESAKSEKLQMPDYFSSEKGNIGAHISLVYPKENNASKVRQYIENTGYQESNYPSEQASHPSQTRLGRNFSNELDFRVTDLVSINAFDKIRFFLIVESPELLEIRNKYGLAQKLNYRGILVPFHITIAISF